MDLPDAVAKAVLEGLRAQRGIDDKEHAEHHRFIAAEIKRREELRELYKDLRRHLAQVGILGLVTVLATLLWLGVQEFFGKTP